MERVRRIAKRLLALLAIATIVATIVWWPWVGAQARGLVVLASVLRVPVLEPAVELVTREPRVDDDAMLGGVPSSIFRPGGDGPWPAVLFLTGADEAGRRHPAVVRLGEGLARAGYVVVVPDLPGMRDGRVGGETVDAGRQVVVDAAALDDVKDGRVALASVSAGASLALVIAADDEVEPHVSIVAGIAPYARVQTVVEIAVTGSFRHDGGRVERFDSSDWMRTAMARSLFALTDDSPRSEALQQRLLQADDPIDAARALTPRELGGADPSGVVAVLRAESPEAFDDRYAALPPEVRRGMDRLSPIALVSDLDVPIELAAPPRDKYFPLTESRDLVEAAPHARLTVTSTLEHAIPSASLDALGDLAAFDAFVVRMLRTAAE